MLNGQDTAAMVCPDFFETENGDKGYSQNETPLAQDESAAFDMELARLAGLSALEYERQRQEAAKRFAVQATRLDKLVRERKRDEAQARQTEALPPYEETDPWPEPVDGAALLDEIETTIGRFVICDPPVRTAAALWAAFTWFVDVVQVAPIALITAPEKECGKSTMLDTLAELSARAMPTCNIAPAALYRCIEKWRPTLMIDEADTFMKDNEELRGIINSGHKRKGAYVTRCVGDNYEPAHFSTWAAKAIAGIGRRDETVMSRSIVLELRRKLGSEHVDSLSDAEESGLFFGLRARLARFAQDAKEDIRLARPDLPASLFNRQGDNWKPLFAIADAAGGRWPELARRAALFLAGKEKTGDSIHTELLAHIREAFETRRVERISTADLLVELNADEEATWATWNRGEGILPKDISRRLKGYGIKSRNIRMGSSILKGYLKADFTDTFTRFLTDETEKPPPIPPETRYTQQSCENNMLHKISPATQNNGVASEIEDNSLESQDSSVLRQKIPPAGPESEKGRKGRWKI